MTRYNTHAVIPHGYIAVANSRAVIIQFRYLVYTYQLTDYRNLKANNDTIRYSVYNYHTKPNRSGLSKE